MAEKKHDCLLHSLQVAIRQTCLPIRGVINPASLGVPQLVNVLNSASKEARVFLAYLQSFFYFTLNF